MCIWNETIAGRGANEIISCLLQFLRQLRSKATKSVCYSDSCFGQNKNFSMICFRNTLILEKMFDQIDHKFLVHGHTFLPNDRDFSHIEKKKASAIVYVPNQWEDIIASCWQSNPFQIQHMTSDHFFDFGDLEKKFTRCIKDTSKKDVLISKVTWMNFGQAVYQPKWSRSSREASQRSVVTLHVCLCRVMVKSLFAEGEEKDSIRCKSSYAGVIPKWSWC